jgi:hypothetical protein
MSNHNNNSTTDTQHKVANQVVHNGFGSVKVTNHLEFLKASTAATATVIDTDKDLNFDLYDSEMPPLPRQDSIFSNLDDFTDSDSENTTSAKAKSNHNAVQSPTAFTKTVYEVPPSLRKPFKIPRMQTALVITPQVKQHTRAPLKTVTTTASGTVTTDTENIKESSKINDANQLKEYVNTTGDNRHDRHSLKLPNDFTTTPIYHSPFLFQEFKLSDESLDLVPELESLRSLILLQHKAFAHHIKELGTHYLNATKILEKKLNSLQHLKTQDKIPRSLRIKCELTTSPDFSNDPEFLNIKSELKQEVDNFIHKGTTLMAAWAERNIKLLRFQCCSIYLKKAFLILEGLTSFYIDSIGNPSWPLVTNNCLTLFFFKAFLCGNYINANDFINSFDLTTDQILLIGAKLIINTDSTEDAKKVLNELNLTDIDLDRRIDSLLVSETLTNFGQILHHTTTGIWISHKERAKKASAGINLSSKMKAIETLNATEATVLAIAKATENTEISQLSTAEANLRINNLERSARKQEHKTNELSNQLKHKHQQKNYKGSHVKESMTSPTHQTPTTGKNVFQTKRQLVDLTLEDNEDLTTQTRHKRQKQSQGTFAKTKARHTRPKAVQWKDEQDLKIFNPHHQTANPPSTFKLAANPFIPQVTHTQLLPTDGPAPYTNTAIFQHSLPTPPTPQYFIQATPNLYSYPTAGLNAFPYQMGFSHYQNQQPGHQANPNFNQTPGSQTNPFGYTNKSSNNAPKVLNFGTSQTIFPKP